MTNSASELNPTENPLLNKLKEKWEAGDFTIDADSVYGVDEAIESAGRQLIDGIPGRGTGPIGPDLSVGVWEDIDAREFEFSPLIRHSKDPLPHHKTCRFCENTSRDNYCIACYRMIREAAEWVQHPRKVLAGNSLHPCVICDDNMILNIICLECMNALLGL